MSVLSAERIGHGYRVLEDQKLYEKCLKVSNNLSFMYLSFKIGKTLLLNRGCPVINVGILHNICLCIIYVVIWKFMIHILFGF